MFVDVIENVREVARILFLQPLLKLLIFDRARYRATFCRSKGGVEVLPSTV